MPRRTPIVLQMEALECGAASLSMVLGHFGRFVPLELLRTECAVSRDGSKASNILRAARKYGLVAQGFQRDLDDLEMVALPAILFWEFNHFVVLTRIRKNSYTIHDPALGERVLNESAFSQSFTGVVLEFSKGPNFTQGGQRPTLAHVFKQIAAPIKNVLSLAAFSVLLALASWLLIPALVRSFLDDVLVKHQAYVEPILSLLVVGMALRALALLVQHQVLGRFELQFALQASARLFWRTLHLPIEFFSQRFAGDISSRISLPYSIGQTAHQQVKVWLKAVFVAVLFSLILLRYDAVLAIMAMLGLLATLCHFVWLSRKKRDLSQATYAESSRALSSVVNGLYTIETVKATGREAELFARLSGVFAKLSNARQALALKEALLLSTPYFLSAFIAVLVLFIGASQHFMGLLTLGMLVAFRMIAQGFFEPAIVLGGSLQQLSEASFQVTQMNDIYNYPKTSVLPSQMEPSSGYSVELQKVGFGYDAYSALLLKDISFQIRTGFHVAIVGRSGSGKSTLAKLIAGLYQPSTGVCLVDGKLAYVEQDSHLFAASVLDNLTLFNPEIQFEVVQSAARDACIHDDIEHVLGGYDAFIKENGRNLSGGQMQRLEIARALAAQPQILVLDEATSALDPITEERIGRNLAKRELTLITVAHRLSSVRDADQILVIDQGAVVQTGTHQDLIQKAGLYRQLVSQTA